MEISLDQSTAAIKIQSYSAGAITINGQKYHQVIAINSQQILSEQLPKKSEELTIESFKKLDFKQYEVVLLGTGKALNFPAWDLLEQAQVLGTPLEVMASDAACRTFTVLADEGRKVLAIIYP